MKEMPQHDFWKDLYDKSLEKPCWFPARLCQQSVLPSQQLPLWIIYGEEEVDTGDSCRESERKLRGLPQI